MFHTHLRSTEAEVCPATVRRIPFKFPFACTGDWVRPGFGKLFKIFSSERFWFRRDWSFTSWCFCDCRSWKRREEMGEWRHCMEELSHTDVEYDSDFQEGEYFKMVVTKSLPTANIRLLSWCLSNLRKHLQIEHKGTIRVIKVRNKFGVWSEHQLIKPITLVCKALYRRNIFIQRRPRVPHVNHVRLNYNQLCYSPCLFVKPVRRQHCCSFHPQYLVPHYKIQ